jgi:hypothetical protein
MAGGAGIVTRGLSSGDCATRVDSRCSLAGGLAATELAPIALIVYGRPEHTRRTLEGLKENELAGRSDLFIFADGPRSEAAAASVREVRQIIRAVDGFKSVTVVERERNFGISNSVIAGVSQLCQQFGRAIVVEDDVLTAPDFLTFINYGLKLYEHDPRVFSVCGFNLPMSAPRDYPCDAFFSYRFLGWGWGTWKDRWEKADWSVQDFPEFMASRDRQRRFNRGGNDLSDMLARHVAGKVDWGAWDTVYAYTHSKYDALALLPVTSKTYNIGMDGSGVHCRRASQKQNTLHPAVSREYLFPDSIEPDPHFSAEIARLRHRPLSRKLVRMLLDRVGVK